MQSKLKKKWNIYPSKLKLGGLGFKGTYSNYAFMLGMLMLFQGLAQVSHSRTHTHIHITHLIDPWVRKILWRRKWQPTSVFVPRKFHGQRRLAGYSPWGCRVGRNLATLPHYTCTHTHTPRVLPLPSQSDWEEGFWRRRIFFSWKPLFHIYSLLKAPVSPL